jgi:hypothetical protein
VSSAFGAVSSIFNALTSPVRDIIRAVTDVTGQAIGILNLVNNATYGAFPETDLASRQAIGLLENSAGILMDVPETIFQNLGILVSSGGLSISVGFLQDQGYASLSSSVSSTSRLALLSSGAKYTSQSGAFL